MQVKPLRPSKPLRLSRGQASSQVAAARERTTCRSCHNLAPLSHLAHPAHAQPPRARSLPRLTVSVCWHPQHSLLMMFCVTFCTDLPRGLLPDRKSVRDKKAEDRFSALLAESPKSTVLYDITPDGIYTRDTYTVI